jgi:hypothetical protein
LKEGFAMSKKISLFFVLPLLSICLISSGQTINSQVFDSKDISEGISSIYYKKTINSSYVSNKGSKFADLQVSCESGYGKKYKGTPYDLNLYPQSIYMAYKIKLSLYKNVSYSSGLFGWGTSTSNAILDYCNDKTNNTVLNNEKIMSELSFKAPLSNVGQHKDLNIIDFYPKTKSNNAYCFSQKNITSSVVFSRCEPYYVFSDEYYPSLGDYYNDNRDDVSNNKKYFTEFSNIYTFEENSDEVSNGSTWREYIFSPTFSSTSHNETGIENNNCIYRQYNMLFWVMIGCDSTIMTIKPQLSFLTKISVGDGLTDNTSTRHSNDKVLVGGTYNFY